MSNEHVRFLMDYFEGELADLAVAIADEFRLPAADVHRTVERSWLEFRAAQERKHEARAVAEEDDTIGEPEGSA